MHPSRVVTQPSLHARQIIIIINTTSREKAEGVKPPQQPSPQPPTWQIFALPDKKITFFQQQAAFVLLGEWI